MQAQGLEKPMQLLKACLPRASMNSGWRDFLLPIALCSRRCHTIHNKYIASELPLEKVKAKYGNQYNVVLGDLHQSDDLRVPDYNGYNVFYNFRFSEMAKPVYCEEP